MYKCIKSKAVIKEACTKWFERIFGVRRGENLTSLLFSLYLNDLEKVLLSSSK